MGSASWTRIVYFKGYDSITFTSRNAHGFRIKIRLSIIILCQVNFVVCCFRIYGVWVRTVSSTRIVITVTPLDFTPGKKLLHMFEDFLPM